jgi:hypothetical protein
MTLTLKTRTGKQSPLLHSEVDENWESIEELSNQLEVDVNELKGSYGATVTSLLDLAAIEQASIPNMQRRYVSEEFAEYFYVATAETGDIAPDDQEEDTGFWFKRVLNEEEVLETEISNLPSGTDMPVGNGQSLIVSVANIQAQINACKTAIEDGDDKIETVKASHGLNVVDIEALEGIPQAQIPPCQRRYVTSLKEEYYYDAAAEAGDVAPDDQVNDTGFWIKIKVNEEEVLETEISSLPAGSDTPIANGQTILLALANLQAQIDEIKQSLE